MRKSQLIIVLIAAAATALGACGKKKGSSGESKSKRVDTWLPKKLKATSGKVAGHEFTIQLPEGLKIHEKRERSVRWIPEGGDQFDYPQFDVGTSVWMHPTSPADARQKHLSDKLHRKDVILKAASAAGGILLVYKSHTNKAVYAKLFRTKGDKKFVARCLWIRPRDEDGAIPRMDRVAAWLERICSSFQIK